MQESILKKFPEVDISVSIVWIEMLPTDSQDAARNMAASIADPRVAHYFDPRHTRLAGDALAKGIIKAGAGPAWDVYLFYESQAEWGNDPPAPVDWCHQLSGAQRADPARFAGGVVADRLAEIMGRMVSSASTQPPRDE